MKTWEEIFKDRLGEREIPLPDESLAEFQAKLDSKAGAPAKRQTPLVWIAAAVAASLAAFVFLHRPAGPEPGKQTAMQPSAPVAVATDSTAFNEPEQDTPPVARAVKPKVVRQPYVEPQKQEQSIEIEPEAEETTPEEAEGHHESFIPPFVPKTVPSGPVTMKIWPAAGIVAGSGLLAAVAAPIIGGRGTINEDIYAPIDGFFTGPEQDLSRYELSEEPLHYSPLRLGLSFRIPVAGKLNLTTGLEYSLFPSQFHYRAMPVDGDSGHLSVNSGQSWEATQQAHYLGIPLRLDCTLASDRWLEIYVGGGFEADYCVGATLAGERIRKDGFGFSLLGAGGVQLNLSDRIGLYVEPEISWTIPSRTHVLRTYRTDHPLSFSLASGVRISLGK